MIFQKTSNVSSDNINRRRQNPKLQTSEQDEMFTWNAKLILEVSGLFKHLYAMVVGVSNDNVLVHAKAEAMRGIELTFARAELTKLAPANNSIPPQRSSNNVPTSYNSNTAQKSSSSCYHICRWQQNCRNATTALDGPC